MYQEYFDTTVISDAGSIYNTHFVRRKCALRDKEKLLKSQIYRLFSFALPRVFLWP